MIADGSNYGAALKNQSKLNRRCISKIQQKLRDPFSAHFIDRVQDKRNEKVNLASIRGIPSFGENKVNYVTDLSRLHYIYLYPFEAFHRELFFQFSEGHTTKRGSFNDTMKHASILCPVEIEHSSMA